MLKYYRIPRKDVDILITLLQEEYDAMVDARSKLQKADPTVVEEQLEGLRRVLNTATRVEVQIDEEDWNASGFNDGRH